MIDSVEKRTLPCARYGCKVGNHWQAEKWRLSARRRAAREPARDERVRAGEALLCLRGKAIPRPAGRGMDLRPGRFRFFGHDQPPGGPPREAYGAVRRRN